MINWWPFVTREKYDTLLKDFTRNNNILNALEQQNAELRDARRANFLFKDSNISKLNVQSDEMDSVVVIRVLITALLIISIIFDMVQPLGIIWILIMIILACVEIWTFRVWMAINDIVQQLNN